MIKLTKFYANDIELSKTITLTDKNPSIIITEKEYDSIFKNKKSLFEDGLILTDIIEEEKEIKNKKSLFEDGLILTDIIEEKKEIKNDFVEEIVEEVNYNKKNKK